MSLPDKIWYGRHRLTALWMLPAVPLSWLCRIAVALRGLRALARTPLPVPVIVVGNLTVGGTGKTPMVICLAKLLQKRGYKVGIVSRGYRAQCRQFPHRVSAADSAVFCGDEPKLLAQATGCPVVIDPKRRRAAKSLLATEAVDVVLSDDGLQHVSLPRALEIVMVDGARKFGNRRLLPAGPLREPIKRLAKVDFIVVNGGESNIKGAGVMREKIYRAQMRMLGFRHLTTKQRKPIGYLKGKSAHLNIAIAHPQRVVNTLVANGIKPRAHEFPDHHLWQEADFAYDDDLPIVVTEKDAVKCIALPIPALALEKVWVIESKMCLGVEFEECLLQSLKIHADG